MKVKICGITNYEDAALALDMGADRIGFVMSPSPRRMEPKEVKAIVSRLRAEGRLEGRDTVGVFIDESPSKMARIMSEAPLDEAQIEGKIGPRDCAALRFPWYRMLRVSSVADAERSVAAGWSCRRILVDAAPLSTGVASAKSIGTWAALASRDIARCMGKEFCLAGGIDPISIASVVYSIAPDGVDLSSGVEERPGKKSREKLERLFFELHRATGEAGRAIA